MLFWGGTFVAAKPVAQELGPYTAAFARFLMASLILVVLVMQREGRAPALSEGMSDTLFSVSPLALISLVYLALFGTALAFVWFYRGVHEIGAMRAGLFINLVPVIAVTLGVLILGEKPGFSLLIGGRIILMGLALTNRSPTAPYRP